MKEELLIFKALSEPLRVELLKMINTKEKMCVCELVDSFDISQSKLSYHLKMLLEANLLLLHPHGKWNFYSVHRETLNNILTKQVLDKIFQNNY